ncbi:MAG: CHAP domain-containing protein [Spirochaetota bacterium]
MTITIRRGSGSLSTGTPRLFGRLVPPLLLALLLSGCASLGGEGFGGSDWSVTGGFKAAGAPGVGTAAVTSEREGAAAAAHEPSNRASVSSEPLSERQARILRAAEEMLTTQSFVVSGTTYSYDCTGTVLAIYAMAGIHVVDLFPNYTGNGVARLYGIARDNALLYDAELPQPGDLIFWDNTYDKNGDAQWNDWLTHVGLVLAVDNDGTIDYLHHHYTKGVVRARMNLRNPETHLDANGVIVNSPMRMRSHRHLKPDEWLSSHLYRELGALHRLDL